MGTSKGEIREWFQRGLREKDPPGYMIVICDTFDHEDYPDYARTEEDARKKIASPGAMQRVMEVYDLRADMETQLALSRCFALK